MPADEPLLPHGPETDAAAVLVGLMEWAARGGVDFEAVLRQARDVVAERAGKGKMPPGPPRRRARPDPKSR